MSVAQDILEVAAAATGCEARYLNSRPVEAPHFASWRLWHVADRSFPPNEVCVAEREGAVVVPEFEDGFAKLVDVEEIQIADDEEAARYIELFIRVTKPGIFIKSSLSEIAGLNQPVADKLNTDIAAPKAEARDEGWMVTVYLLEAGDLIRGEFKLSARGHVEPSLETIAEGISVFTD